MITPIKNDPMLSRGTDYCRCMTCGLYFNSTFAFTEHRVGKVGTPERRCLTEAALREAGWGQGPRGHWLTARRGAGAVAARRVSR